MKLIDILIAADFEWDERYGFAAQDPDGEVWAYSSRPAWKLIASSGWNNTGNMILLFKVDPASDYRTAVITRKEYMQALKDNQDWVKITKEQIKSVPVGGDIRINGEATKLKSHYNEDDYGFKCEDPLAGSFCDVFADADWAGGSIVEVKSQLAEQQKPQGHPHAALMAEYAEVARTNPEPWLEFQARTISGDWVDLTDSPSWYPSSAYRRKPRTIRVGDYDVPEPVREPLEDGQYYFATMMQYDDVDPRKYKWINGSVDTYLLKQGRIHLTKEAAELHTKALLSFTQQ